MRTLLRRTMDELWLLKEGRRRKPILEPGRYQRLVFVCTGNICRSVYAERYAKKIGLQAVSRGLITTPGCPPDPTARLIAEERGTPLDGHLTASWNPAEIESHDLVLVMEPWQLRRVVRSFGKSEKAAGLLGLFEVPERTSISDPYGSSVEVFRGCFSRLERAIEKLAAGF